jgi:hypothetical protein
MPAAPTSPAPQTAGTIVQKFAALEARADVLAMLDNAAFYLERLTGEALESFARRFANEAKQTANKIRKESTS